MIRGHSLSARFDDQAKKSANDSSDDDDDDDASDGEVPAGFSKELTAEARAIVGDGKMSEEAVAQSRAGADNDAKYSTFGHRSMLYLEES